MTTKKELEEEKAKTLKVGVVPWQLWIKSPAYLKLTPEKKIASLLHIIKRKEEEIVKLKELFKKKEKAREEAVDVANEIILKNTKLEEKLEQIQEHTKKMARRLRQALEWNENEQPFEVRDPDEVIDILDELVGLLGQKEEKPK